MSDNLVLELLRAIRGDIGKLGDRMDEHNHRLNRIEISLAGLRRDQANDAEGQAAVNVRLDRMHMRLDRIERRLDLVET